MRSNTISAKRAASLGQVRQRCRGTEGVRLRAGHGSRRLGGIEPPWDRKLKLGPPDFHRGRPRYRGSRACNATTRQSPTRSYV
jgi:hypothetical protein